MGFAIIYFNVLTVLNPNGHTHILHIFLSLFGVIITGSIMASFAMMTVNLCFAGFFWGLFQTFFTRQQTLIQIAASQGAENNDELSHDLLDYRHYFILTLGLLSLSSFFVMKFAAGFTLRSSLITTAVTIGFLPIMLGGLFFFFNLKAPKNTVNSAIAQIRQNQQAKNSSDRKPKIYFSLGILLIGGALVIVGQYAQLHQTARFAPSTFLNMCGVISITAAASYLVMTFVNDYFFKKTNENQTRMRLLNNDNIEINNMLNN
jgi:hypothetical protein